MLVADRGSLRKYVWIYEFDVKISLALVPSSRSEQALGSALATPAREDFGARWHHNRRRSVGAPSLGSRSPYPQLRLQQQPLRSPAAAAAPPPRALAREDPRCPTGTSAQLSLIGAQPGRWADMSGSTARRVLCRYMLNFSRVVARRRR